MNKYYVTTSIAYVNGEPHLGYAMELIQADVLARYARITGKQVIFSTGTDEHGGKIKEKAAEQGLEPQIFVDKMSKLFADLAVTLDISNDRFIRTTNKVHEEKAALIWQRLAEDIYKGKYVGWYCTGDEAFVTESEVKANNGTCPSHNRPYERLEEENYFFKLSNYTKKIAAALENNDFIIYPETRRNEIISLLDSGLEDISISRPKDKINWGIDVPGDKSQVMYVWFEALMNYITVLGYPSPGEIDEYWPADVQVIGKDIIRFHAAIWPAMLMSLGLRLPKSLYVHGFITVDGKKMGKSLGNYISPIDVIDKYSVDAFRYYLLRHIPSYGDGDFSWQHMDDSYNNELANELGNALQRTTAMIIKYQDGVIGDVPPPEHDIAGYQQAVRECRFDKALGEVWNQIRGLNQYIDETKPWVIAETDKEHLKEVLAYQVCSLLEISTLLSPFMPSTAEKIAAVFAGDRVNPLEQTLFPKQQVM